MEPIEDLAWYCLRSRPKHEHIAAAHLRQMQEVEVFCPRVRYQRETSAGARWFEEAMFPGYLFSRFPFAERNKQVLYANGISGILRFGERYARIEDSVIGGLQQELNAQQVAVVCQEPKEGQTVKVVHGALRGLEAVVTQILTGAERIRVLVHFLGRDIYADANRDCILGSGEHPLAVSRSKQGA